MMPGDKSPKRWGPRPGRSGQDQKEGPGGSRRRSKKPPQWNPNNLRIAQQREEAEPLTVPDPPLFQTGLLCGILIKIKIHSARISHGGCGGRDGRNSSRHHGRKVRSYPGSRVGTIFEMMPLNLKFSAIAINWKPSTGFDGSEQTTTYVKFWKDITDKLLFGWPFY